MSVNWYWKSKLGEIRYRDLDTNKQWKLEMFGGNMMCCFIYRYRNEKNEKYYNFFMWFNDINHAKRVAKDDAKFLDDMTLGNHKVLRVKINARSGSKYRDREMMQFANLLVKCGYKVELYSHINYKNGDYKK